MTTVYLGAYIEENDAARAYDLAALKYWGPEISNFNLLNFKVLISTQLVNFLILILFISMLSYIAFSCIIVIIIVILQLKDYTQQLKDMAKVPRGEYVASLRR